MLGLRGYTLGIRSKEKKQVNHPSWYNKGKIEVIDAIEDWKLGFNLGNAVKYVARSDIKENKIRDLEKAIWYINREIQLIKWPDLTSRQAQAKEQSDAITNTTQRRAKR